MKRIFCLSALMLLISAAAFADIARPDPTKTPKPGKGVNTTMTIRMDRDAAEPKLIIPKSQIKQLRAELEQLDSDTDNTAAVSAPGLSRTQTIVSGMFLSLAVVFGGMWFVRSGKAATKTGKSLLILAVIAGIGSAATLVYANAGPPRINVITSKIFDKDSFRFYSSVSGKIRVETSNESGVVLVVPDPKPELNPSGE
ncbi:MAG: hypothetical protein ACKVQJ_05910 [Pyrinomonadaceae bacterium]